MPQIIDIKDELNDAVTLKFIASAFTEASAAKIKKIRENFERNRSFYEEISHIYHLVKESSLKRQKTLKTKDSQNLSNKNSGTLLCALTSNQRFYGNINVNIMRTFVEDAVKTKSKLFIIGHTGFDYIKTAWEIKEYESLSFEKENPNEKEIRDFLDKSATFEKVIVYYPQFVSLVSQKVGKMDITQTTQLDDKITLDGDINILFEPELTKMLEFFEQQVRSILFLRIILESDLARTAARLISMSSAEDKANDTIKEKRSQIRKAMNSFVNARLLETFAGINRWKK